MLITLFISCSSTTTSIVSIRDESFKKSNFTNVVVSAPYEDLQIRSSVESLFKRTLTNFHTKVYRAMDILPPLRAYTDSEFAEVLRNNEIQCVLVVGITDYWQTYYSTPGKFTTKTDQSSSSHFQSYSQWDGLLGIRTTGVSMSSGKSTTTTRYTPGITLSQSNVSLDIRMFVFGVDNEAVPIWRANSTTSGSFFTPESKVFVDAAKRVNAALRSEGLLIAPPSFLTTGTVIALEGNFRNLMIENLTIVGGPDYSVVLGCLACDEFKLESVLNKKGNYGVNAQITLWDPCGIFASDTSQYSACNPDAKFPPIVLSRNGKQRGVLSVNSNFTRTFRNANLQKWLLKDICVECQ